MSPNEARLERLKTEVGKFPSVSAFARKYNQDENYIRQLLKGRRSFGERAARKMGEEHFGSPDYFFVMRGSAPAVPPAPQLSAAEAALLAAIRALPEDHQALMLFDMKTKAERALLELQLQNRPAA